MISWGVLAASTLLLLGAVGAGGGVLRLLRATPRDGERTLPGTGTASPTERP